MRLQEEGARVRVGGDALEEGEGVADAVGGVGGEGGRGEERVDGEDFLFWFFLVGGGGGKEKEERERKRKK